jgi:hypothetical protein
MWSLYKDFEVELNNRAIFDPLSEIFRSLPAPQAPGATMPQGGWPPAIVPPGASATLTVKTSIIESSSLSSSFSQEFRFVVAGSGANLEPLIRQETLAQGWHEVRVP